MDREVNNNSPEKIYFYHTSRDVHLIVRCIMLKKRKEKNETT